MMAVSRPMTIMLTVKHSQPPMYSVYTHVRVFTSTDRTCRRHKCKQYLPRHCQRVHAIVEHGRSTAASAIIVLICITRNTKVDTQRTHLHHPAQ
jgi:hypothetical protein